MTTPAHKQTDPAKLPGQIVASPAAPKPGTWATGSLTRRGNPKPIEAVIPPSQRVTWDLSAASAIWQARSAIRMAQHYGYTIEQITEGL